MAARGKSPAEVRHRESTAKGARLGLLGPIGWFLRPGETRSAIDGVSPITGAGTRNVLLWCLALAAVVVGGRALAPDLGSWWGLIGLAVMVPIGWKWPFGVGRAEKRLVGQPPK